MYALGISTGTLNILPLPQQGVPWERAQDARVGLRRCAERSDPSEGWEQVAAWESRHARGSSDMCLVSYAAPFGKCSGEQVSRPRVASLSLAGQFKCTEHLFGRSSNGRLGCGGPFLFSVARPFVAMAQGPLACLEPRLSCREGNPYCSANKDPALP